MVNIRWLFESLQVLQRHYGPSVCWLIIYQSTAQNIPEELRFQQQCYEKLKCHIYKLHESRFSFNNISSFKLKSMRWTMSVARITKILNTKCLGTRWRSWLRHCATSGKVAGSIPNRDIGVFHWQNPSRRTMGLELTQPQTEMSTRNISLGSKGDRCVGLTTLPPSCADYPEIWETQTPGALKVYPGL